MFDDHLRLPRHPLRTSTGASEDEMVIDGRPHGRHQELHLVEAKGYANTTGVAKRARVVIAHTTTGATHRHRNDAQMMIVIAMTESMIVPRHPEGIDPTRTTSKATEATGVLGGRLADHTTAHEVVKDVSVIAMDGPGTGTATAAGTTTEGTGAHAPRIGADATSPSLHAHGMPTGTHYRPHVDYTLPV